MVSEAQGVEFSTVESPRSWSTDGGIIAFASTADAKAAETLFRQQAERIAELVGITSAEIDARMAAEGRIAALEAASAAWQSLASDYWAAYPFGRLGERYRALLGDSK